MINIATFRKVKIKKRYTEILNHVNFISEFVLIDGISFQSP